MKKGNISVKSHILTHDNKKKGTLQKIISEEYRVVFSNNAKKMNKTSRILFNMKFLFTNIKKMLFTFNFHAGLIKKMTRIFYFWMITF